ncbi:MAG TPA: hypothetical protein VHN15_02410 [Thermoanaerobaculia bacterium]|nr:hypothetical protein [Thermoanaerobaculia bacterium]
MRRAIAAFLSVVAALCATATPALAEFGLRDVAVTFVNEDGTPATRAGTHPFAMTTELAVETEVVPGAAEDPVTNKPIDGEVPQGQMKDLTIVQMPGFVGDQTAIPRCPQSQFTSVKEGYSACPDEAAVGVAAVKAEFSVFPVGAEAFLHTPIYNLEPPPGVAARLGFVAATVPVTFDVLLSQSPPYNLVARLRNTPQALLFYSSKVTLWGDPSHPAHDTERGKCIGKPVGPTPEPVSNGSCPVQSAGEPLLTLPRACEGPLQSFFAATSWQGAFDTATATTTPMSDCGLLPFSPQMTATPTATAAESPSGIDVDIQVQDEGLTSPTGTAQSDIRAVRLALPAGMTANPSAAEGLGVCTPSQYAAASLADPGCPPESKLGTVRVTSELLEDPVQGAVFLAAPDDPSSQAAGAENPFDSLLALYLVIRSPKFGLFVKQAGEVEADERTGQLVSTFSEIPQLPFAHLNVHLREGARAPLITPPACGTHRSEAELTPWSGGPKAAPSPSFDVLSGPGGGACPPGGIPPFSPGFSAGTLASSAGAYAPLFMRLTRSDGHQDMTRFDSELPPGLIAKIAGVERCPDAALAAAETKTGRAELASPSCPANSRIGRVLVGAGAGSALTHVPGTIYLAGPYAGRPLSVAVVTPAVAGPFDVGTVVVREALDLDPRTGAVRVDGAASDPIPHILRGIPLKLRDLRVYLDREDFTLNATGCEPMSIGGTLFGSGADPFSSADDRPAALSARYQASNCASLGFKPRLSLRLSGGTKRGQFPGLRALVRPRPGDSNIGGAVVTLPRSAFLEQGHIRTICTRVQFAADNCPKGSVYGFAKAVTPLLDGPLQGPVYLRSSNNKLPDLVAALKGPESAPVEIELVGRIDSLRGRIRSTFSTVPDAPVTRFTLTMQGGRKGLIVNSVNLCASTNRAKSRMVGQNGVVHRTRPLVRAKCKGKPGRKKGRG